MRYTWLACGLIVAITASAEPGVPRAVKGAGIQSLDIDGDGMITLAEVEQGAPHLAERFSDLDTNNDGVLSNEEISAGRPMRGVRSIDADFAAADANSDGKLSRSEAKEMPIVSDFFNEMDTSSDGYVTMEEIHAHAKSHGPVVKHVGIDR